MPFSEWLLWSEAEGMFDDDLIRSDLDMQDAFYAGMNYARWLEDPVNEPKPEWIGN